MKLWGCLGQGKHPKHKGIKDPDLLGTVERYFLEIMDIPRLQQRIQCLVFTRTFQGSLSRVSSLPLQENLQEIWDSGGIIHHAFAESFINLMGDDFAHIHWDFQEVTPGGCTLSVVIWLTCTCSRYAW
jgi:hypothetical protein